jgi:trehalose-6-phosphatase
VRWILRLGGFKGDQEDGLKQLTLVAEHGRYLAPFAQILLAFNDLRQQNRAEARKRFAALHDRFPGNPLYPQEMAKCDRPLPPNGQ